jgi:hypothetical protein
MMRRIAVILAASCAAFSAELVLPSTALERDAPVHALFRTSGLATGRGSLSIEWTDAYGRVVDQRAIPVELQDESQIGFDIDLRRAVAMRNELHAHFTFDGKDMKGRPDHRDEDARFAFVAKPPDHTWWDYAIIMWQHYSPEIFSKLKPLGIDGSEFSGRGNDVPDFLLKNDLRWYAENIATDFYSQYHRYYPDRDNGYEFQLARQAHMKDPTSLEPFKRHPSLTDREWLQRIHDRLVQSARTYSPYRPFFYSLGDETGIAELEAAWDFDLSEQSLVPMREWLRQRYGTLAELNAQWGTQFRDWNAVMPMTTDQAMKRTDDNFSAWSDFKEWMDIAWANALRMGTDAIHSVDPEAYVGIGGGQMPGWGGYDYSRLVKSLTAIEPYDIGGNIEIIRSLNPDMAVLTTSFEHGPWEKQRVWYELMHGNRGLILWDDKSEYLDRNGNLEERGREAEGYYNEIRNGIGALLINSRRVASPIAIHYSQPSLRVEWLLENRPRGEAWAMRSPKAERTDNEFLRLRESWCRVIEDAGLQYNFVSYDQVEQNELLRDGYRVLILPRSSALSAAEVSAIRGFAAQGGLVVTDGEPGTFDEHGRKLAEPALAGLGSKMSVLPYQLDRITGKGIETRDAVARLLTSAGVRPDFALTEQQGKPVQGVETHLFRNGDVYLVGLLSNPSLRVDELGPPDFRSNEHFAVRRSLKLTLPQSMAVYDVRAAKELGRRKEIMVELNPYEPAIFAISAEPLPSLVVAAPARIARGSTGHIGMRFEGVTPAETHILHVDVTGPDGRGISCYSGNLRAPRGQAEWALPIAYSDAAGKWSVRVKDLLTGQTRTAAIDVY